MKPPTLKASNPTNWQEVLRRCGYPAGVLIIDFETYFDKEYKMGPAKTDLSTIEYVTDSRFQELGAAVFLAHQPYEPFNGVWLPGDDKGYMKWLQNTYGENLEGLTVVAHNYNFDGMVLNRRYGIKPRYPIDLLGLARQYSSRSDNALAALAKRHGMPDKGGTDAFKGLRLTDCAGEAGTKLAEYARHDVWLEWELFKVYLPRFSRPEVELRVMRHTLDMFQSPSIAVAAEFAGDLEADMGKIVDDFVRKTGCPRTELSGNISFAALLEQRLVAAGDTIAKYQKRNKKGLLVPAIALTDPERDMLLAHPSASVREILAARIAIKSWPNHISRIRRICSQAKAAGGLLPVPLHYCGAHTGRWSGGERINLQNLSSRGDPLVNSIRHLLIAPRGHKLVIVDASQVEARGLAWIAGQNDLCDMFRAGVEIYCEYASKMAGLPLRKAAKSDPPVLGAYYTRMRNMGKVQVLGCGYGMGANKCISFASSNYGIELTASEAETLVKGYRKSVPRILKFWRTVEQKFKAAARHHEHGKMAYGLEFYYDPEDDLTVIRLPSGRILRYKGVRISMIDGRDRLWMPHPRTGVKILMWGGYLTENIVQALCRDLLAENTLAIEAAGYRVALLVHDEVVCVVPDDQVNKALKDIIGIMSLPPEWAKSCPLDAEGQICTKYGK